MTREQEKIVCIAYKAIMRSRDAVTNAIINTFREEFGEEVIDILIENLHDNGVGE